MADLDGGDEARSGAAWGLADKRYERVMVDREEFIAAVKSRMPHLLPQCLKSPALTQGNSTEDELLKTAVWWRPTAIQAWIATRNPKLVQQLNVATTGEQKCILLIKAGGLDVGTKELFDALASGRIVAVGKRAGQRNTEKIPETEWPRIGRWGIRPDAPSTTEVAHLHIKRGDPFPENGDRVGGWFNILIKREDVLRLWSAILASRAGTGSVEETTTSAGGDNWTMQSEEFIPTPPPAAHQAATRRVAHGRPPGTGLHQAKDAVLVEKMHRLVVDKIVNSPTAAARQLLSEADGSSEKLIIDRLVSAHNKRYSRP